VASTRKRRVRKVKFVILRDSYPLLTPFSVCVTPCTPVPYTNVRRCSCKRLSFSALHKTARHLGASPISIKNAPLHPWSTVTKSHTLAPLVHCDKMSHPCTLETYNGVPLAFHAIRWFHRQRWFFVFGSRYRLQGCKGARLQGCKASRVQGFKGARLQGCKGAGISFLI